MPAVAHGLFFFFFASQSVQMQHCCTGMVMFSADHYLLPYLRLLIDLS